MSVGNGKVLSLLVKLIQNGTEKVCMLSIHDLPFVHTSSLQVQCQACLALRNLASDGVSFTLIYAVY